MSEKDYWTLKAMDKFGGSFVQQLANLARRADPANLAKIKDCWYSYWNNYEELGEVMKQEEK